MTEAEALELFRQVGAFRSGHFVFTSGRHSDTYVNKDALYTSPEITSELCKENAARFAANNVEAVIGPAIAAAILAQWTAFHLSALTNRPVIATYADKVALPGGEQGFAVRRGYDAAIKGKRTLIVEDLTTTGGSVKKVHEAAQAVGAHIVGVAVLVNRGKVTLKDIGNPLRLSSLLDVDLVSWAPDECPLCRTNVPVNTDIGHGKAFLESKKRA